MHCSVLVAFWVPMVARKKCRQERLERDFASRVRNAFEGHEKPDAHRLSFVTFYESLCKRKTVAELGEDADDGDGDV